MDCSQPVPAAGSGIALRSCLEGVATSLGLGSKCRTSIQCFTDEGLLRGRHPAEWGVHCFPRGFPFTAQAIPLCHRTVTSLTLEKTFLDHLVQLCPLIALMISSQRTSWLLKSH